MKITVKSKFIVLFSIVTAALLMAAVVFLITTHSESTEVNGAGNPKSPEAVPVDAIALFTFAGAEDLSSFLYKDNPLSGKLFFGLNQFKTISEKLSELFERDEYENRVFDCAISLHYSAKDKVSPLFVFNSEGVDNDLLLKTIESSINKGSERSFNGVKIFRSEGVEYSITDNKLIASTSPIIIESSLRHIKSKVSILDNEEFSQAFRPAGSSGSFLFINHLQTGKLFSAYIDREYFGGADFISRFSGWSKLEVVSDKYSIELKGITFENKGVGNYSTVFRGAGNGVGSVQSVLPSDTYLLLDISVDDIYNHIKKHLKYKEYYGKSNNEVSDNAVKWFESLKAKEAAVALIPYKGKFQWLTIIRKKIPWYNSVEKKIGSKEKSAPVRAFHNKGYAARLFGGFFSFTKEESILESGEWIFIGEKEILNGISAGIFKNFTFEHYLSRTKAHNLSGKRGSMVTLIVNGTGNKDSLFSYLRDDHAVSLKKRFSDRNIMITALEINSDKEGEVYYSAYAFADSMAVPLPPPKDTPTSGGDVKSGSPVYIAEGPFEVKNFTNGQTEFLEQLPAGGLRLLSKERRGIWTIPFNGKIRGRVLQIDYFKNGKLQMLFADQNHIYLLDRLGRFVKPFPRLVTPEILSGPQVYDLNGDGDVAIMLLHRDNTLRLYDKNGEAYPMWSDIAVTGTIKDFPEMIKEGAKKYLVLRTESVTEIYTSNGIRVTNLTGNNRLSNSTTVESAGNNNVAVKTVKGKKIFLNLETGNIKQGK